METNDTIDPELLELAQRIKALGTAEHLSVSEKLTVLREIAEILRDDQIKRLQ